MTIHEFIKKLQGLPDQKKKIVIIGAVIFFSLILGVFWVKSTGKNLVKMGESLKSMDFSGIDVTGKLPSVNNITNSPEAKNISDVLTTLSDQQSQADNRKTYTSDTYGFEIKYPDDWVLDKEHTTDLEFHLSKQVDKEQATIDAEIVSQTRKIQSPEKAIDKIVARMKNVISPKGKIAIGSDVGYEAIGTLCTSICNGSSDDVYSLLSVIYFSHNNEVFYVDYIEGVMGQGWESDIKDWKYYGDFKNILSTFKFTNTTN